MNCVAYAPSLASEWDAALAGVRQQSFLFRRGYMDYHADRFADCSLMVRDQRGRVVALFPANREADTVWSHQGLTYGGLIATPVLRQEDTMEVYTQLLRHYRQAGVRELVVKPLPYIYHTQPAQEELYALHRLGAQLSERAVAQVVDLSQPLAPSGQRRRGAHRAEQAGVEVVVHAEAERLPEYWALLTANLQARHGVRPVHTLSEISLLRERFPSQIQLHLALAAGRVVAGVVSYANAPQVLHTQYISASAEGRALGALDLLLLRLIHAAQAQRYHYFDFGISTEQGGTVLNAGLTHQKEGFGGRAVCYDLYRLAV